MTSNEVATVNPEGLLRKYEGAFTGSLPTHINHDQWMNVTLGALRSNPKVAEAAANNPGKFLAAVLNAARLGLEIGTEQFYLVPQSPKKGMKPEILAVVGYQGLVELMYRAGAVASVIVECVYSSDKFSYVPGRDERPIHEIDWDAADRGKLRLVYAYAVMKDGATSKVVVLNRADIDRIKQSSASASSSYSPWTTQPAAMWMKTAARQLAKWVPTSAEYRRQQLRDVQQVMDERERRNATIEIPLPPAMPAGSSGYVDQLTGEVFDEAPDDDVHEAEWSDAPTPANPEPAPSNSGVNRVTVERRDADDDPEDRPRRRRLVVAITRELVRCGVDAAAVDSYLPALGVPRDRLVDLTQDEAEELLAACRLLDRESLGALVRGEPS